MGAVILALLYLVPQPTYVEDTVDVIEINHYYDEQGRVVLEQLIFWDGREDGSEIVVAWRILRSHHRPPTKRRRYEMIWSDGDVLRRVYAKSYRETWTEYDPELCNRNILPKEQRRGLSRGTF